MDKVRVGLRVVVFVLATVSVAILVVGESEMLFCSYYLSDMSSSWRDEDKLSWYGSSLSSWSGSGSWSDGEWYWSNSWTGSGACSWFGA
jgi:hypothetical protein